MRASNSLFALEDFARNYIRPYSHHSEIRTEHLVETFRQFYGLPPFPDASDLRQVCARLGITITALPEAPEGLIAVNTWHDESPTIHVRPDASMKQWETTIPHEIREVLENAFKRAKPKGYAGLDTHDNRAMNGKSDRFAGHLLMQSEATHERLWELGFDLPRFASERGRSLSSVVVRLQELYSKSSSSAGPVGGVWLFEAPWRLVARGRASASDLVIRQRAHIKGFSLSKRGPHALFLEHGLLPRRELSAAQYALTEAAIEVGRPVMIEIDRGALFDGENYFVIAEPFFVRWVPWRVLVFAVRDDSLWILAPWIDRLGVEVTDRFVQFEDWLNSRPGFIVARTPRQFERRLRQRPEVQTQYYPAPLRESSVPGTAAPVRT
ncbi:MAG TPA: hypothetical protein VNN10_13060 [Dehalococcoidia bacterium]|nr:hypothetical protein [Dehalococcoidia bacterium]